MKGASVTLNQKVMRGAELLVEAAHVQLAFVSGGRARKPLRIAMKTDQETGGVA
jgi:acyl-CoA thioester hydrolase